jgi:DNA-binding CsgD family transcriptional regulator
MRQMSAVAHFRQLCCLGIAPELVVPSLLSAIHEIVPSEINGFHWADESGHMVGFVPEYVIPEVVTALVDNFDGLIERCFQVDFTTTMRHGKPLGNLLPAHTPAFYHSDLYHLIYRPYNLHHVLDLVVRDTPDGVGTGALIVGRSARQPPFGSAETGKLLQLLPYIAHALHGRETLMDEVHTEDEGQDDRFADSGNAGLVILDGHGHVAYSSARARQILYYMSDATGSTPSAIGTETPAPLRAVFDNLVRIAQERDAPPPVVYHRNRWGRFVMRGHWLEPSNAAAASLVGVTIQQQEPLALVMMRNMHVAGLSERQRQVCLLLAQNRSFALIASQLHISLSTAKDYADRIYRKLDVHTRDELLNKLH